MRMLDYPEHPVSKSSIDGISPSRAVVPIDDRPDGDVVMLNNVPQLPTVEVVGSALNAGYLYPNGYTTVSWAGSVNGGTGGAVWVTQLPPQPTPKEQAINAIRPHLNSTDAKLTESDLALMREHGIMLKDLLKPGIYQAEFNTAGAGEHRQWIRVNAEGQANMITANPLNGKIDVVTEFFFEGTHTHGVRLVGSELRLHAVGSSIGNAARTDSLWSAMMAAAESLDDGQFNYNFLVQNSNSVFYTVGQAAGLEGRNDGWQQALGYGRDLRTVDLNNQIFILDTNPSHTFGSGFDDNIQGGPVPLDYAGLGGNDTIFGGSASDYIDGGDGADTITMMGGLGRGGAGADILTAAAGAGQVDFAGNDGDDFLYGSTVNDVLDGGIGNDVIYGRDGNDQLTGQSGNDSLYGEAGDDVIIAGTGTDTVDGGLGNDLIMGEDGADTIDGGSGNDILIGGGGRDTIRGGDGDDFIRGGVLGDQLWGGSGQDTFVIDYKGTDWFGTTDSYWTRSASAPGGYVMEFDTIWDFVSGVDKIDLRSFAKYGTDASDLWFIQESGGLRVGWFVNGGGAYGFDGEILLAGISSASASDFIFQ